MGNDEQIGMASVSSSSFLKMSQSPEILSLKRKRPPNIEIPNVLQEISGDLFAEGVSRQLVDGPVCFADSGVGVFSLKGKKKFMEDAYQVFVSSTGDKRFFGVYDGHGGSKAAEFVAENLHLRILEMLEMKKVKEEACKAGYLKTDEEFLKQGLGSGACCVSALIEGREMVVSNLGDCRAVLCRDGSAEALTTDHRPTREDERRRIEDKGGFVEIHRGTWRVHGTLAVSRSIGDAHLKDWVMAEPDIKVVPLSPEMQYLVLASDGLWEEVSNQEAADIVMQSCSGAKKQLLGSSPKNKRGEKKSQLKSKRMFQTMGRKMSSVQERSSEEDISCENGSPPSKSRRISVVKRMKIQTRFPCNENDVLIETCKKLARLAVDRGSLDDITVMIVDLNHY